MMLLYNEKKLFFKFLIHIGANYCQAFVATNQYLKIRDNLRARIAFLTSQQSRRVGEES